jgi:GntR family transcriptional repressor for pyruvate dehydrogenase complex
MGETTRPRGQGPPLAGALAQRLRARIASGELRPGDRLPGERALAEGLGVHRGSLREALRQLERLRLVATRPGSGTRVLDPQHASFELVGEQLALGSDGRWLRDLLEVRELIATGSLRALFERHARGHAALREVARTLDAIAAPTVPAAAFLDALWELPASLARASGNQVLVLLANSTHRFLQSAGKGPTPELPDRERQALTAVVRRLARSLDARDEQRAEKACASLGRKLCTWVLAVSAAAGSS